MYCAIKICMGRGAGGGGSLIETIFYCSSAASGWKRGKRVLNHMECYNSPRLKTAMSNSIPALVPTGHSSLAESSASRIWVLCALSSSKCSQNACLCRQLCNCSRDEVSLCTSAHKGSMKSASHLLEYWVVVFLERDEYRWSLHWSGAKCRKNF